MSTFECPSGLTVELREMTGHEEAILADQRQMRDGRGVNTVLRNCIVRLGDKDGKDVTEGDVLDLLSGDRMFLIVRIRQITHGDDCDLAVPCTNPRCGEDNSVSVIISELPVSPYPEAREHEVVLPKSGKIVKWSPLTGREEARLAKMRNLIMHDQALIRIREMDGKPPARNTFLGLDSKDHAFLRNHIKENEGGIDTALKVTCDRCGARIETSLEVQPDFLFPTRRV